MFLLFPLIAYALLFACVRHYDPVGASQPWQLPERPGPS